MSKLDTDLIVHFPDTYPEIYDSMGQVVVRQLHNMGMPAAEAKQGAINIMEAIRTELGGGGFYLAKGQKHDLSQRDMQIYERFNDTNHFQLSREFDLTEMQIRNVIKKVTAAMRAKRQKQLFE